MWVCTGGFSPGRWMLPWRIFILICTLIDPNRASCMALTEVFCWLLGLEGTGLHERTHRVAAAAADADRQWFSFPWKTPFAAVLVQSLGALGSLRRFTVLLLPSPCLPLFPLAPRRSPSRLCHDSSDHCAEAATLEMTTFGRLDAPSRQDPLGLRVKAPINRESMQEQLTDSQAPASSRASSFFIENLLGKGRSGQESVSGSSQGEAGVDTASISRLQNAHHADTSAPAPDGCSSTSRSPYRDSPLQWYRGGTALNFRALEIPHSE